MANDDAPSQGLTWILYLATSNLNLEDQWASQKTLQTAHPKALGSIVQSFRSFF